MTPKGGLLTICAALAGVVVLCVVRVSGASADMQPRVNDKDCEDPSQDVRSPDGLLTARFTTEACDYGFGSNSQNAWVDVFATASPSSSKKQVLQLVGPNDDLEVIKWRDNEHLEVDVGWPISIKKSLHEAGEVNVVYVASAPRLSLNHGSDYDHFMQWAKHNAEGGTVLAAAPCSRYTHTVLREPCQ